MKAISLYQPYASWIAQGKKTIETRFWSTKYRGDLLIVSTKKPVYKNLPLGKALCIVNVVNCRQMRLEDENKALCKFAHNLWAWELEDLRPIEPFNVKGSQGFYEVDYPVKEQKAGQMALFK